MRQKKLPADFSKISQEFPKANVLSSIAGTQAAQAAVLEASIPQTVTVNISKIAPLQVKYNGDNPVFAPIKGPSMNYAINTDDTVIQIGDKYYCCHEAIWYQATATTGPWTVATAVPKEISTIPPDSPVYNVKYAQIYNYDQDADELTYGYTSGYDGTYYHNGTIVYGTGCYYNLWYRHYYYPRPVTYDFHARYNSYTGKWGYLVGYRAPNGGIVAWKPSFGSGNVRWRAIWNENSYSNRHRPALYTANHYTRYNQARHRIAIAKRPVTAGIVAQRRNFAKHSNNVLSDRNWKIYRKNMNGWEIHNKGAWQQVKKYNQKQQTIRQARQRAQTKQARQRATSSYQTNYSQLNRQMRSRSQGAYQTNRYKSYRRSTSYNRSGFSRSSKISRGGGFSRASRGSRGGGFSRGGRGGGRR